MRVMDHGNSLSRFQDSAQSWQMLIGTFLDTDCQFYAHNDAVPVIINSN